MTLAPGQLLQRHEPVVVLHPDERFAPVAVDAFLADARLVQTASGPVYDHAGCSADVGVASIECYAASESARRPPNVVYGAVRTQRNRIVLQYWYWYSYNFWSGDHPPTDFVWQAHEGDWEAVIVVLTRSGRPLVAGYSQHSCGNRRAWARVPKTGRTHPVVRVALGSHANELRVGDLDMDLRPQCYDAAGAGILRAALPRVLDRTGNGTSSSIISALGRRVATRLVRVTASSPSWMRFPGAWGEANVFHAGGRSFLAGLGPRGPAFHDVWRDPLGTLARWPAG